MIKKGKYSTYLDGDSWIVFEKIACQTHGEINIDDSYFGYCSICLQDMNRKERRRLFSSNGDKDKLERIRLKYS